MGETWSLLNSGSCRYVEAARLAWFRVGGGAGRASPRGQRKLPCWLPQRILYYCDVLKRKTERVIWEGDLREGDAGIGLLDASRDDEGLYSCEVVNIAENKQQKTTVRLTIREPGSSGEQSDPPAAPANQRSEAEAKSGTNVAAIIAATSLCVILVVGSLVYVKWKTNGTRAMVTAYKAVEPGRQGQGGGRPLVTITVTDGSFGGSQVKQVSVV
ncbi:uncharacterized protein LOC116957520 isoform X2 [Petromyzon marinus]|uniref:uncharacterized protein LOC116957520 isoform X2 n=1 Tax=Petromyzon marinus TaxID=7757 RepID=UPI003F6F390F